MLFLSWSSLVQNALTLAAMMTQQRFGLVSWGAAAVQRAAPPVPAFSDLSPTKDNIL
jgi:hypothetical protein